MKRKHKISYRQVLRLYLESKTENGCYPQSILLLMLFCSETVWKHEAGNSENMQDVWP